ncbi:sensor histidine kinase [Caulobacter endophyticus]|uniref:sensor histidine kinase n=1 Tax=Caulobacter endophyticus TaxID=2172652 RepID=UPI00240F25E0|nr:ATP-binding protein [Caulobacter endophyticus]MDG2531375.1 ATP-binding protein [Caulobacter endophyticus]
MHDRTGDVLDVSANTLAGLLDAAHEPILVRDLEGRILFWNQGCEDLYGHGRAAAQGALAPELLGTVFPAPIDEIKARLLADGRWEGEVRRRVADGREAVIALRWSLRRDASGAPLQVLETGRDVTEARKAEEALRRSEYRFRNVFHAMSVSFWELDFSALAGMFGALRAQGVTSLRAHIAENPRFVRQMMEASQVVDVNDKSLQLFEATREQLLGPVDRFWPPCSEHVFAASVIAALEKKPHYESEARFRTYDGREFDGLFTCCYPREYLPQGATLVGVIDITDRLRAQEDLARVQAELAHAARISTLGELTASIAHEVNQPLSAIVTNGEAGLRWLRRQTPDLEEVTRAFDRMIGEANRASGVIGRIRTMAVKGEPETARLSLAALVEDSVLLVRRELTTHDVALRVQVPAHLPQVDGDRVQLQQVLVNLMVNAVQAMAQSQERVLVVRAQADGEGVTLSVADTGPGVPPERAAQLFNAFYTTKAGGMGMGLSICRTIAQAHGGEIVVESRPGEGATFVLRLPRAADSQGVDC